MNNHQCLPFTEFTPNVKEFPSFLPKIGFRLLSKATPEDFTKGCIVVLYNIYTLCFETVVVKNMENDKIYYCHQTGREQHTWFHSFIGDPVYNAYLYKVIS